MRSTQKITRVQLKIDKEDSAFLLGLVSAEPDYKLSLTLNKKFKISLRNIAPVKIIDDKGLEQVFSRFSDTRASTGAVFNLVSNRTGNNHLLKKLKNVDYIFQVQDPENENNLEYFTARLRDMEAVNAVFNIDISTFKDKNLQYLNQ
jgi:hypothetical protein